MPLCVLSLGDVYSVWRRFLARAFSREFVDGFTAYCRSPRSRCFFEERWRRYVERIEGMGYSEYWRTHDRRKHIQISDRWVGGCGLLTRIYIRSDGAIVFSHSEHGYSGVHVLIPVESIRRWIAGRIKAGGAW